MILQEEKVEIVEEKKEEQKVQDEKKEESGINNEKASSKHILMYFGIFFGILFLILLIIYGGFTIYNIKNNDKIANGISIYGIDVSGLTQSEAISKVSNIFKNIEETDLKLYSNEYETVIKPSEIDLKYNISTAVKYVFSIGKTGNIFSDDYEIFNTMVNGLDITPTFSINENALTTLLNDMSKELPHTVIEGSYYVENNTLIITKGSDGLVVDTAETIKTIKSNLANFSFLTNSIPLNLTMAKPKDIDINAIYEEVHKDAKDAYFTTNPYAVYPSETGIDFKISLEEAKQKLAESDKECKIALKTVYPKITTNMIGKEAFPDLLGEFSTHYVANPDRTTNLKLAAAKINGTVLLPGEVFAYNKVVGERTIAAGYKEAAIYQNGQVVDGLGGGVCQISTTLFNAALFANLEMVEVHNHQFVPSYVGAGRDATVAYGSKDFKFKNSRNYAIKIECSVSGGIAKFRIYGVKENTEYKVNVNAYVTNGDSYIKSTTYRTLTLNGKQISKEKIYSCTYKKH